YQYYDRQTPQTVNLLPGQHYLWTSGGATVYFTVKDDGTIDYDAMLDVFLSGRGTNRLVVRGSAVQTDARALVVSRVWLSYGSDDGQSPFTANLLPGQHPMWTGDGASVSFTVAADGTVDYDASLNGILSGRGTKSLAWLRRS